MKNILSAAMLAVVGLSLTGCDDLLDNNRYPETLIVDSPQYWDNPDNCELQVNRYYQYFYGYGSGQSTGSFYFQTLTDDQCAGGFTNWKFTAVPSSSGSYDNMYTRIRGCNIIIEKVQASALTDAQKANYIGLARLYRGYEYYNLVRQYGDVILVDHVLDVNSPELYAARTDRKTVMDFAYEDLKYASENITLQKGIQKFSKDLALAMLSNLCLFEGTFWKYCTKAENYYDPDPERAKKYLELCVTHSAPLLDAYPIGDNYRALYNSAWTADAGAGITGLSNNPEVIFATEYKIDVFMQGLIAYTCSSSTINGISKDAFDAYLFKDGLPKSKTSMNTTDVGVPQESVEGAVDKGPGLCIQNLLDVRDGRLAQTTDPYIYYKNMTWARSGANPMTSASGYGVSKYDNVNMPLKNRINIGQSYTCSPLYWGAVIALNYAEAKAELGTLNDDDMNKTLNKLYARADLPAQTVASLSAINDDANNMGVSSLIWEVRRCRRCELIMDYDYRYWDLIRWHKLDLLDNTKYPNVLLGANVTGAPVAPEVVTGAYINATYGKNRIFEPRQYQYPLPSNQLNLNKQLEQNALWK